MAKVVIAELDINVQELIKSTSEVKTKIDELKKSQKELTDTGDTSSQQFIKNAANLKLLNSEYSSGVKAISDNTKAITDQANRTELLSMALSGEVASIAEARESNKILNKLRNETNVTTDEGKKQLIDLNAKLDQNNAFIKQNGDAYLKQKINIGNYKEDIKGALGELNLFNGGLQQFGTAGKVASIGFKIIGDQAKVVKDSFGEVKNSSQQVVAGFKNVSSGAEEGERTTIGFTMAQKAQAVATNVATTATNSASVALKAFKFALISTGIGAIIIALGSLISFLSTTQAGIDAVTSVTRPLQAVFQTLLGVIQNLGQSLFNAFQNPKQVLTDLSNFVKQNLINRFTAFGKILQGIVELDFKKLSDGVLQASTGVEDLTGKISKTANATGKVLTDALNKGKQIDQLTKQIENSEINLNKQRAIAEEKMIKLRLISKDTSINTEDRVKAQNEIVKLSEDEANRELSINVLKVKRLKIEQTLNDTSREGFKELSDLEAEGIKIRTKGDQSRLEGIRVTATLNKEAIAERQKAESESIAKANELIDNSIEKSKVELDLFIESQGIKAKSLAEELQLAEQIRDKKLAILKTELQNNRITQNEFNLETLRENNIFLLKQAEATVANADKELKDFIELNQSKIQNGKFLTNELVNEEISRLASIEKAQLEAEKIRFEQGLINKIAYDEAIAVIEAETRAKEQAIIDEKLAIDLEKKLIDEENKIAANENEFEQRQLDLDRARQQEVDSAEKTGADVKLINEKYATIQKQIDEDLLNFKLSSFAETFGMIKGLFKENTLVAKAAAIAEVGINTFVKANESFNQAKAFFSNPITVPLGINAAVQGGLTIASGVATAAKISGIKFEKGGIQEVGGNRHSQGGTKFVGEDGTTFEAEQGEGIGVLNRGAFSAFMDFNNNHSSGGISTPTFMQGGGIITQGVSNQSTGISADEILNIISNIPPPVVAVTDINTASNNYVRVVNGANFN